MKVLKKSCEVCSEKDLSEFTINSFNTFFDGLEQEITKKEKDLEKWTEKFIIKHDNKDTTKAD